MTRFEKRAVSKTARKMGLTQMNNPTSTPATDTIRGLSPELGQVQAIADAVNAAKAEATAAPETVNLDPEAVKAYQAKLEADAHAYARALVVRAKVKSAAKKAALSPFKLLGTVAKCAGMVVGAAAGAVADGARDGFNSQVK